MAQAVDCWRITAEGLVGT